MKTPDWAPETSISEIKRLTDKGMLGFYSRVEVTEVIAFPPDKGQPINLLTLLVAEEVPIGQAIEKHFLNPARIRVSGLRDWNFGICRYSLSIDRLIPTFERLVASSVWDASGDELCQNALAARPPQFVPPDSFQEIPWNRVLKNNFWNGSYVFEWADTKKPYLLHLFESPHQLQALSEAIQGHIPIRLASLSDRLGSIVLQLPVTVLMAQFEGLHDGNMLAEIGWHPLAQPRPLRASVELEFDHVITGFRSSEVQGEKTLLPVPPGPGDHRGVLWDDANGLVLAATGPSAFIKTFALNMCPFDPEPRAFSLPDENGINQSHRVRTHSSHKSIVGPSENDGNEGWTRRRMYQDETARLVRERRFVQYRPQPGQQATEHEKALKDIRQLISQHGEEGTWLWDPYLSALDILKTLFFSPHSGSDLRGLTAREEPSGSTPQATPGNFFQRQKDAFANAQSNFHGLHLEFRAKIGQSGWNFHDRFLIFPRKERGALAWSLGTSVNSVGKAHHILQRVDDGQRVMDAFVELWDELNGPEHLIWKVPAR